MNRKIYKVIAVALMSISLLTCISIKNMAAISTKINVNVINDTLIFSVPGAKTNDSIYFTLYYKTNGVYSEVGGKGFPNIGSSEV